MDAVEFFLEQSCEILWGDLLALAGGYHAFIGEAFGYFFDPIVEG